MMRGDAGVRLDHALVMHLTLPPAISDSSMVDFYRRLDANLLIEPGVRAGGVTTSTPLSNTSSGIAFEIPGRTADPKRHDSAIDQHATPGYAAAAGLRIEEGRPLGAQDAASPAAQRVVVINRYMADAMWPHASAIGRVVMIDSVAWTVAGVASNVHHGGLDEPMQYTVYRSLYQSPRVDASVAVWTQGDPASMRDAIRGVVARTDPSVAVGDMMTMTEMRARHVSVFAMMAAMLGVLAIVTMTIATVGLYGLIAYGVAQRTREIGVRIALGARGRDILAGVAGGAMRLTAIGIVVGIAGAFGFARLLGALLYGVTANDPRTPLLVSAVLLVVALVAALVPAWRASRVAPTVALRDGHS
jgi:predicted permease